MSDKIVLLSSPQMSTIADEMISLRNGKRILERGHIEWDHFPDGTPKTRFLKSEELRDRDVAYLACFDPFGSITEQMMALGHMLGQYNPRSLKFILPFYPTGTMDRWEKPGEVVTAKQLANQFISLPKKSRVEIIIYDIHALQEESFFHVDFTVTIQSAVSALMDHIESLENVSIAYPDEGAYKRYKHYFKGLPEITCEKRKNDKGGKQVWVREGDPKDRHVFIIDDLILTAGTGILAQRALLEKGASEVSWFAAHGAFPENSWEKVSQAGFSEVWITDSCPQMAQKLRGIKPFKIMPLAPIITDLLSNEFDFTRSR